MSVDLGGEVPGSLGALDRARFPYRMKDLCEKTGLPRQVVHFYIQQGLVPDGHKTGRNMAYYGEQHVERIRLVRELQHERFLPLKVIRAMLEQRDEVFSPAQRRLLVEVKARLQGTELLPREPREPRETVLVSDSLRDLKVSEEDLRELIELGLLAVVHRDGIELLARGDLWLLEVWAGIRAVGFTRARGFTPRDFVIYEEAISRLFDQETRLMADRLASLAPEEAARMLEGAIPLVNTFLARYHLERARSFFAAM